MFKKKDDNLQMIDGIFTDAIDYDFIDLVTKDYVIGFLGSAIVAFFAIFLFFGSLIISLPVALIAGVKGIPKYKNSLIEKRKKKLLLEFRDLLDSLNNSMAAGNNINDSFNNALIDMRSQYGNNSPIAQEVEIIIMGMYNNITIEELLDNFADRSHLEDIKDFSNTFNTCIRLGGNLKRIVSDCKEIITQKIDIELEIKTIIAANKNQLNIIAVMPFVLVGLMSFMGFDEIMEFNPVTIIVKVVALIVFIFAYMLGMKMTDIKV